MRPSVFSASRLLLALLATLALSMPRSVAEDAAPSAGSGRIYASVESLASLVEGLGYEGQIEGNVVSFRVARGSDPLTIEVRLLVSPGALDTKAQDRLQLFVPIYHWTVFAGVPAPRLAALLEKNLEIAPSRFYILEDEKKVGAWVGLQRTIDNRAVRPTDVRKQIEALYDDVRATQPLWDPDRWAK